MKKFLSLILVVSLVLSLSVVAFAENPVSFNKQKHTIKEYEEFLINQPNGKEELAKFRKLSVKAKQEVVNAVYDPEFLKAFVSALSEQTNENTMEARYINKYSNLITIKNKKTITPIFEKEPLNEVTNPITMSWSTGDKVIGYTVSDTEVGTFAGFEIFQVYGEVTYDFIYGEEITNVQDGDISVTKNLMPLVTTDVGITRLIHTTSLAQARATIVFGAGIDDIDLDVGGARTSIKGSYTGSNLGIWFLEF